MKYLKLLPPFIIILTIDLVSHYLIELKWVNRLNCSFDLLCFFVFCLIAINGILGWLSLRDKVAVWLQNFWIGFYLINLIYFIIRYVLYAIGLFPDSFLFNGSANFGLSVFIFCTFWLIDYFLSFRLKK